MARSGGRTVTVQVEAVTVRGEAVKVWRGGSWGGVRRWSHTHRQSSLFWHSVWVSLGRPPVGQARIVMVSTRARYHYAIRAVKKRAEAMKAQKQLEASQESVVSLLEEMKKIRRSKKQSGTMPDQVGEARGEEEIEEEFRRVYQDAFKLI